MDKRTIRKFGVNEIENAYHHLAIETMDQMLTSTARVHDRRIDLLDAMGDELKKRGSEGMRAIDRLSESSDMRVRYCICGVLKSIDMDRTVAILQELADSPGSYVATRAASTLATFEAMKRHDGL